MWRGKLLSYLKSCFCIIISLKASRDLSSCGEIYYSSFKGNYLLSQLPFSKRRRFFFSHSLCCIIKGLGHDSNVAKKTRTDNSVSYFRIRSESKGELRFLLHKLFLVSRTLYGFLVSKITVVLRRWERSKQKFGFMKRVDKG